MFKVNDRVFFEERSAIVVGVDPHANKALIQYDDNAFRMWLPMSVLSDRLIPLGWDAID